MVSDADIGREIQEEISDLYQLLELYRSGTISPKEKE